MPSWDTHINPDKAVLPHPATHQLAQLSVTVMTAGGLSGPHSGASLHCTSTHTPQPPGGLLASGLLLLSMDATAASDAIMPNPQAPPFGL